jgi:hypothetical protein
LRYSLYCEYRNIFPRTVYASGAVKEDSAGAKMRERVKAKRLESMTAGTAGAVTMAAMTGTTAVTTGMVGMGPTAGDGGD